MKTKTKKTFHEKIFNLLVKSSDVYNFNQVLSGLIGALIFIIKNNKDINEEKTLELSNRLQLLLQTNFPDKSE